MYLGRLAVAFVGFILLIFLVIFLLVGHGPKKTPATAPKPLASYASTDTQVVMTINGAINGDDTHRVIQITVDQNSRELDVIQGYNGNVIQNNTNYNTEDAYSAFLSAINVAGFTIQHKGVKVEEAGQCPLGQRINFQLQQDGNILSNLWTTSCSNTLGTLGGNSQLLQQLFQNQITNYETLTENVDLD
jgi:hypothetical protein